MDRQLASKKFTDREDPLKNFNRLLSEYTREKSGRSRSYRIIDWHGDGGQGKSSLCHRFLKEVDQRQNEDEELASALLDFDDPKYRNVTEAMLKLRQETSLCRHVTFSTFDAAFTELFRRQSPQANIRECHPYLFRQYGNEFIEDFLSLTGNVDLSCKLSEAGNALLPGIGVLFKWGTELTGRTLDWWQRRGTQELVDEMTRLSDSGLREKLPYYMGRDILQAMEEEDKLQVILLLDTFEALSDGESSLTPNGAARTSRWVKTLIKTTPGALVVIFGRDRVQWPDDEELNSSVEYHLLEGLSNNDATKFLVGAGVHEEAIRDRIVSAAAGVPYYLDLAVDDYWHIKQSGREPTLEDFGKNKAEVVERFLSHLSESERNEILIASYPETLDEELFTQISQAFLGGIFSVNWKRLTGRSFINVDPMGRARMHRKMKEHMQETDCIDNPARYKYVHKWLFNHYNTLAFAPIDLFAIDESHDLALISASYHRTQYEPGKLLEWFNSKSLEIYYNAERWHALSQTIALVSKAAAEQQETTPDDLARLYHSSGHILQRTGDLERAIHQFQSALNEQERINGEHEARTLQALADVLIELEIDLELAREHFLTAKEKYLEEQKEENLQEEISQHAGIANCLVGLAVTYRYLDEYKEARVRLDQAYELYPAHIREKNDPDYIRFLRRLHVAHCAWEEFDDAFRRLDEALAILKGSDQIDQTIYAEVLTDLASCPGRFAEASRAKNIQNAVEACTKICGSEHRLLGRALYLQVKYRVEDRPPSNEDIEQLRLCHGILERTLGPMHEWTIAAQELLGFFS